jgi:lipopolysaccharide transport system permease protein
MPAAPPDASPAAPVRTRRPYTLIRPGGRHALDPRLLLRYRDLFRFLVWRDIQVRFGQTAFGVGWVVIQPLFTVAAFSVFFGKLGRFPSEGLPYPLFALAGQLAWQLFARVLSSGAESMVHEAKLVTKVYFPRALLALSQAGSGLLEMGIVLAAAVAIFAAFGIAPGPGILALPLFVGIVLLAACGAGLFFAALNVRYRDVRHAIPFVVQMWFLVTPVAYPSSLVPEPWRPLHALNPVVGAIDGFRWALLGAPAPAPLPLAVSCLAAAAIFALGTWYFHRFEATFADEI